MDRQEILWFISNTALVGGIGSFLTGLGICRRIWRKKSTIDVEPAPFLAGFSCTFLWFRYAYLIGDRTMIPVNALGVAIFAIYIVFYFFMTKNRRIIARKILLTIAITTAIIIVCSITKHDIFYSGLFACGSSLAFCASPLASLRVVLRTKSTDSLPFPMILCTFVVSSLWLTYGYLIDNNFLIIPNALSSLISGLQLCLFAIFRKEKKIYNYKTMDAVPFMESFNDLEQQHL